VPVFNDESTLLQLLAQLQPLRSSAQIIVVDGAPPVAVPQLLTYLTDSYFFCAPGRALQMHAGAACASAPVLWFLHADSRIPSDALIQIEMALQKSKWGRFDIALEGKSAWLAVVSTFMNWRSALSGICTGDQGIFVTANAYRRVGGFSPIPLMEDIVLSRDLKLVGSPARVKTPLISSGRRWDSKGPLKTILLMWSLRFRFWLGQDPKQLSKRYHA
jgi:rSAM/selenodomain-associated transferase 2